MHDWRVHARVGMPCHGTDSMGMHVVVAHVPRKPFRSLKLIERLQLGSHQLRLPQQLLAALLEPLAQRTAVNDGQVVPAGGRAVAGEVVEQWELAPIGCRVGWVPGHRSAHGVGWPVLIGARRVVVLVVEGRVGVVGKGAWGRCVSIGLPPRKLCNVGLEVGDVGRLVCRGGEFFAGRHLLEHLEGRAAWKRAAPGFWLLLLACFFLLGLRFAVLFGVLLGVCLLWWMVWRVICVELVSLVRQRSSCVPL